MSKWKNRYFVKFFAGPEAFSEGFKELQQHCGMANQSIADAIKKAVRLEAVTSFIEDAWPQVTSEKLIVCVLTMQALLAPSKFNRVHCSTSFNGLLYRTHSGSLFGWRKLKDGRYIFMAMPGTFLRPKPFARTIQNLQQGGWVNRRHGNIFPLDMKTEVEEIALELTQAATEESAAAAEDNS